MKILNYKPINNKFLEEVVVLDKVLLLKIKEKKMRKEDLQEMIKNKSKYNRINFLNVAVVQDKISQLKLISN